VSEPVRVSEAEVAQLAALIGLSIDPADRPAVAQQLGGLLAVARLVTEFPLPDEVEAAPVFRA
jgi:Asp-tRNA(Asn)/Glu-tRNA(Gln) amidotransferase C subunit